MNVLVIGGGVAGLGIGWRLLQAGVAVTILERGHPAQGATWAAAGMLAVTAELQDASQPEIDLALAAEKLWPAFAAEVEAASGEGIGFVQDGALLLAADAAGLAAMQGRGAIVETSAARRLAPLLGDEIVGGLWVPGEARVDNRRLGGALAIAFRKAGGRLLPHEAVLEILHQDGRAAGVLTAHGRHLADAVVLAAGAWSGLVANIPVKPVKGEMIALQAPDGMAVPGPVVWGNTVYLVPRGDRMLVGATVQDTGFDTSLTDTALAHLRSRAESLMPSLKGWALAEHWAGLRPGSADGLPLLGQMADGLFVASGQYRNGILYAPAIARMMAGLVLEQGDPVAAFDPKRFSQELS